MKTFPALLLLLLSAAAASAQTGASYRYDNFDTQTGLRIDAPPAPVVRQRKRVRMTSSSYSNTGEVAARPSPLLYERPRLVVASAGNSLNGFTTGNSQVDAIIVESSNRNGVDPVLLYSIMHQESTFKQRAVSPKGARGLMQLMPATAARFGVTNIFDPRQNIEGGARYMRFLLDMFDGDVELALAGYNAGEGAVLKYGRQIPPYRETQEYVRRITARYQLMRDPLAARNARRLTSSQVAAVEAEQPVPLTLYERNVYAVRLPDGRLQLVSQ
ncbi:MAG TPA: lytic transglycosylase domain-containing protein [Pyrinomonadaceae bacterium]|nr:lytic transglycosylase domain-containing protein [Pyrinomonadaceae bacterium]